MATLQTVSMASLNCVKQLLTSYVFGQVEQLNVTQLETALQSLADAKKSKLRKNVKNKLGLTAITIAILKNQREMMKCLLRSLPSRDIFELLRLRDDLGGTALHLSAITNHPDTEFMLNLVSPGKRYDLLRIYDWQRSTTPCSLEKSC